MSPEQVIGKNLSPGSDIFSLGVVLYETLTGDAPFDGDSVNAIMYATVNTPENPPSRLNRMVPPALDAIVARALAKTPETRYQSAKEFARALREVKQVVVSYIAPPAPEPAPPAPVLETASPQTAFTAAPPQDKDRQMKLSARFDSTVGTLRLAAFTKQTPELEKFISESRRMPAYKGAADAAAAPEALPPLKADVAAGRAAERAQGSLAQVNPALSAKLKGADAPGASTQGGTMGVSRKVPMVPLLLLGGLASTVIALSIVLLAGGM